MHKITQEDIDLAVEGTENLIEFEQFRAAVLDDGKLANIKAILRANWDSHYENDLQMQQVISEIEAAIETGEVSCLGGYHYMILSQVLGKAVAME